MRGYPQFSCRISVTLVKIYISCIIINRGKNIFELVGTVLKGHKTTLHVNEFGFCGAPETRPFFGKAFKWEAYSP